MGILDWLFGPPSPAPRMLTDADVRSANAAWAQDQIATHGHRYGIGGAVAPIQSYGTARLGRSCRHLIDSHKTRMARLIARRQERSAR